MRLDHKSESLTAARVTEVEESVRGFMREVAPDVMHEGPAARCRHSRK
jgi:hypothetical protein